jgi:Predicted hydrolase of the metallo-beta-lactamase superfamily
MAEHVSFAKEMQVPKTLLIENGDIIKILPGNRPEIIDKAPSGKVYLDGNINVETDSQSIKDRKNLSVNGYLEITLIISNNGSVKKPVISYKGIPEKNEDDTFIFDMEDEIMNICRTFSIDNKKQQQNLIETLKQNCRRIVREKTGKKPYTSINIARI